MNNELDPRVGELNRQLQAAKDALAKETIARERAEEKLREVEARSKLGADLARLGGWRLDPATGVLETSDTCKANFGLSADEDFSFARFFELIHPDDRDYVRDALEYALATRTEYHAEYRAVWPDGSPHWIIARGHAFYTADGAPKQIAERARVEHQLRRSEAYLAEGQRLSHTGSWAWDVNTGEIFCSKEHFRIFGLDPGQVKPSYEMLAEMAHPEDRARVRHDFETAVPERRDFEGHYRIIRTDGTLRHVHCFAHPVFNVAGELTEYVGTVIDTTERRRAEKALRKALSPSIPDIMYLVV